MTPVPMSKQEVHAREILRELALYDVDRHLDGVDLTHVKKKAQDVPALFNGDF